MFLTQPVKIVYTADLPDNTCLPPEKLLRRTILTFGRQVGIRAGKRSVTACPADPAGHNQGNTLYLAGNMQSRLLLPDKAVLNLSLETAGPQWRLGPLIGIFACRSAKAGRPFGEQTSFLRSLINTGQKLHCLCYAFGPDDIDWQNEQIRGSLLPPGDGPGAWETGLLPFPDVIYDRGLFPRGDKRARATEARRILRRYPGIKMFNPAFFGKWKTHCLLERHETLHSYLPDTRPFTSMSDVNELLARHHVVYLKPSTGSSGRGILRLSVGPDGYEVKFRSGRNPGTLTVPNRRQLESSLRVLTKGRHYIVQQGLNLAAWAGSPFDIRVLMQKDMAGSWRRTGMALRVAAPDHFISNIHAGGKAKKISEILPQVFPDPAVHNRIMQEIRRICSLTACWVTGESHPLFGEIAIDLGVDVAGKVWIIELNAVPGRSVFRRTGALNILARAVARPMEYACFLSGFAKRHTK